MMLQTMTKPPPGRASTLVGWVVACAFAMQVFGPRRARFASSRWKHACHKVAVRPGSSLVATHAAT